MEQLLEKFINSDIVVIATPVYIDNVTGIMKNFMDRLIPLVEPYFEKDDNGECRHKKRYQKYPKIVVISNCGFPEQSHFQVLSLLFKRIARNMHTEVIAEIYRGAEEILQVKIPMLKPLIKKYKNLLQEAGKEIALNLKLSEKLNKKLQKPIIPDRLYIKGANMNWNNFKNK